MTALEQPPEKEAGLFGVDWNPENQSIIIIGVPWEPTASYGRGTSQTPQAIIAASHQLDFYEPWLGRDLAPEIGMAPFNTDWSALNRRCITLADLIHSQVASSDRIDAYLAEINAAAERLNQELYDETRRWLDAGKIVGVIGGDHSSPYGAIRAALERHPQAGVLHIDAHHDLRQAYEGFTHSHASIMYNVLSQLGPERTLISVGIRDYAASERQFAADHANIHTFYDRDLHQARHSGTTWRDQCRAIIEPLPQEVYISFDIDGLDPKLCPNTGTPVPGGLDFQQAVTLLEQVADSGRKVIGFDLVEVAPDPDPEREWDLNVGARLLHKLCAVAIPGSADR